MTLIELVQQDWRTTDEQRRAVMQAAWDAHYAEQRAVELYRRRTGRDPLTGRKLQAA